MLRPCRAGADHFAQPLPLTRPDRPSLETEPHRTQAPNAASHHLATRPLLATFHHTLNLTGWLGLLRFSASPRLSAVTLLEPTPPPLPFVYPVVSFILPLLALDLYRSWEQCAPRETTSRWFRTSMAHCYVFESCGQGGQMLTSALRIRYVGLIMAIMSTMAIGKNSVLQSIGLTAN